MAAVKHLPLAFVTLITWLLSVGSVPAVTPAELAELAKAGLGDEVLLALVESTGLPAPVDAQSAIALKRAGVSDRVIAAAIRASQPPQPPIDPEPPLSCAGCPDSTAPHMYTPSIDTPAPVTVEREVYREVREVYVYVPVALAQPVHRPRPRPSKPYFEGDRGFGRFINDGVTLPRDPKGSPR